MPAQQDMRQLGEELNRGAEPLLLPVSVRSRRWLESENSPVAQRGGAGPKRFRQDGASDGISHQEIGRPGGRQAGCAAATNGATRRPSDAHLAHPKPAVAWLWPGANASYRPPRFGEVIAPRGEGNPSMWKATPTSGEDTSERLQQLYRPLDGCRGSAPRPRFQSRPKKVSLLQSHLHLDPGHAGRRL